MPRGAILLCGRVCQSIPQLRMRGTEKLLKGMVGPWGLHPRTCTVSILKTRVAGNSGIDYSQIGRQLIYRGVSPVPEALGKP
jgi:hypothetical protein